MDLQIHLSPQLHQTIHTAAITQLNILQMSQQELMTYIYEQFEQNPFIEVEIQQERFALDQVIQKNSKVYPKVESDFHFIEQRVAAPSSLTEMIMEQLVGQGQISAQQWPILNYLVAQLDERLFLQVNQQRVAAKFRVEEQLVQQSIQRLQQLEPFGIAMENPRQFLIAQVKADSNAPALALPLLEQHLEELAKKKYRTIAKYYDCSVQIVEEAVAYIQSLALYPSYPNVQGHVAPIIPDAIVEKLGDEWVIEMQQDTIPKVTLNDYYYELTQQQQEFNQLVAFSMQEAALFIQGLDARQQTLYKVLEKIVAHQQHFLEQGEDSLQPLMLVDVAQMTGLHESTISRAIRGKYVQTPQGIFPIRALFKKGIRQSQTAVTAVHTIQKQIEQLILEEDVTKPLSDNQLVQLLKANGITISRRTVTKYRELLGIPNSYERIRVNQS